MGEAQPLPIEGVEDMESLFHGPAGEQHIIRFPNGYGASVVRGPHTYGGSENLYTVGVITYASADRSDWELTYDTPITNDVLGWQSLEDVAEVLMRISRLPGRA